MAETHKTSLPFLDPEELAAAHCDSLHPATHPPSVKRPCLVSAHQMAIVAAAFNERHSYHADPMGTAWSRSWADLGASELFRQLAYKGERRGVAVVAAPRFYPSSKTCSGCQAVKLDLPLSVKTYVCDACGLSLDRDLNAALNLRNVAVTPTETQNRSPWPCVVSTVSTLSRIPTSHDR